MASYIEIFSATARFMCGLKAYAKSREAESPFSAFPVACCEWTSSLLGRYLKEEGLGQPVRVWGINKELETEPDDWEETEYAWYSDIRHAWLILDSFIIDLTARQFRVESVGKRLKDVAQMPEVVIVKSHPFYDSFQVQRKSDYGSGKGEDPYKSSLSEHEKFMRIYSCVKDAANSSKCRSTQFSTADIVRID